MKRSLKNIIVLVISLALVIGASITAVSATATQTNPKTTGVSIVGNTMMVYENNHNFYVWGKSVLAQCAGFSDILPNNNTKFVDVQFDGNLYKGLEEVIIVKQNNKEDKVILEEGSMIITGVNTLEQLDTIRKVVAVSPKNLAELKYNMALNDVTLGTTKDYMVTKDGVVNENGIAVNPKEVQGAVQLITIKQVEEAVAQELKAEEAKQAEEAKKKAALTPTAVPTSTMAPTPTPCTEHQYSYEGRKYVACIICGNPNPDSRCNGNHNWDLENGQCITCGCYCYHKYPAGVTGAACTICGYNPSARPIPSAAPVCPHTYGFYDTDSDETHECYGCPATFPHEYNDGHCEICNHDCTHPEGFIYNDIDNHKCNKCGLEENHDYRDGSCVGCNNPCPECSGNGTPEGCYTCNKVSP